MGKIDDLIKNKCPNGVKFLDLEKCCNILDNKRKPVTKSARKAGEYPYYGANGIQDYVADYIFDGKYVLVGEDGSVINENGNPIVTWAEGKIWVNNHAHIIEEIEGVSLRYLYHYIQTINVTSLIHGNIPKLNQGDFRKLQIAVPPWEVQDEIVHVLDDFMLLSAELSAELKARQKQYEYYRDKLLNFENDETLGAVHTHTHTHGYLLNNIKWLELKELFDTKNGYTPSKSNKEYWKNGTISWYRMEDIRENGRILSDSIQHVNAKGIKGKLFPKNSIIISTSATIGEHALITEDFLCNQRFTCLMIKDKYKDKYDVKFLFYYCYLLCKWCLNNLNKGNFASVDMKMFEKFKFPIIELKEQKKIVYFLENLDKLCNDMSEGLPAEIEARQKQYEYYRDKLLSFKELK